MLIIEVGSLRRKGWVEVLRGEACALLGPGRRTVGRVSQAGIQPGPF